MMRLILACVDLSASSDAVIDCARGLAAPDGQLVILHVAAPDPDFVGYGAGPSCVRDDVARDLRREHQTVQRLAEGARQAGMAVTPLTVQGATAETILEHSRRLGASFIVVGSRGHGALRNALVGSVVQGLVRGATMPVVVVPHECATKAGSSIRTNRA